MKTYYKIVVLLLISNLVLSCEDDNRFPNLATSLKVFHAAVDAPAVHVDYFNTDIAFATNPILAFGSSTRLTLPPEEQREILFISAEDTLSQLLSTTVSLPRGEIGTLFLAGQGENIEGLFLEDNIPVLTDSLVGVRFINLSPDSGPISVNLTGEAGNLSSGLNFKDASGYQELTATSDIASYSFEFKDLDGNVIATSSVALFPFFQQPLVRRNLTLALIGLADDGSGGSSLAISRINNY